MGSRADRNSKKLWAPDLYVPSFRLLYATVNGLLTVCVRWSRLRVKDINDAIKELGQMIAAHTGSSQPMTRLMIVQEAVTVITALEQQLRGTV